jgi:hypothetical protein
MVQTRMNVLTNLMNHSRVSLFGSWGPGSKQEIALINWYPGAYWDNYNHPVDLASHPELSQPFAF